MNKNNGKSSSLNFQESWATHISDYILQRRQQTCLAYTSPNSKPASQIDNILKESLLFKAIFILLANQLEEGHTVLTLSQSNDKTRVIGQINNKPVELYGWQIKLLELLALPLIDFVHTNDLDSDEPSVFDYLNNIFDKGERLWWQTSLGVAEKIMLKERLDLIVNFYNVIKDCSLDVLICNLQEHALFSNHGSVNDNDNSDDIQKNSLSKRRKPIIFKSTSIINKSKNSITLTLWLHRAWQAEYNLAQKVKQILASNVQPLNISIPNNLNEQQINAIEVANNNAFSIITGGPGTGKTYTVAQLVIALQHAQNKQSSNAQDIRFSTDSASLALAAPTGKAAQRMQESLQSALDASNVDMQLQEAKTIHRLLGIGRNGQPRYNADNPLGEDIIIVDEASMLGVELANYLVSAVKPGARLILLGDANQLAAVDAGAVLADLCRIPVLTPIHAKLTESRRFVKDSGIGKLAHQINQDQVELLTIWQLLKEDNSLKFKDINITADVKEKLPNTTNNTETNSINSLSNKKLISTIKPFYQNYVNRTQYLLKNPIKTSEQIFVDQTISSLMVIFNEFRILSAGHHGEWGDHFINNYLTQWHTTELKLPIRQDAWYHGRPVMVLQNNYELGLYNGDIGICLQTAGRKGRLEVFFENKTQGIAVNLLNEELITTAYAMTVHKSQGSEFNHVAITLDGSHSRLLNKELIYTAVTRAKKEATIFSTKQSLEKAVTTPTQRHTGLTLQFS